MSEKKGKLSELIPDDKNLNKHTQYGMSLLEKSVRGHKFGRSILVDKNNRIIAGNGIVETAANIGAEDIRIIETTGDELVVVKRTDVDLDTKEGREMALADNATSAADLEWDMEKMEEIESEWDIDVSDWGIDLPEEEEEAHDDDFDEDEIQAEPVCKTGDIWQLGQNRLQCGDSTNAEVVARLLGGVVPDMVFTDPPYGINLNGDNSKRGSSSSIMKGGLKLKSFVDDSTIYACKAFDIVQDLGVKKQVWFGANYYCHHLPETNNWLIWDKRVEEKMNNTNSDCELAWVLDGHSSCRIFRYLWNGLIKAGEKGEKRVHPTQKPIALIDHCVKRYAPEAKTILDLFGGSGSTLIAAEQLGIKCFINELDPHYCDVIIARWEKLTGQKARKVFEK